jgi:phospholipid-binding lipoprotein MlaA
VLLNPFTYLRFPGRLTLQYSTAALGTLDKRLNSQADLEAITGDAADPYATLRSVYLQSREAQVRGETAAPELPPIDEPAPAPSTTQSPPGPGADAAPAMTAPDASSERVQEAAASDPDAPMATAFPSDIDHAAQRQLAAAD